MQSGQRHARRSEDQKPSLSMTPMIDVVFLLLIFFILTIKPVDTLAELEGSSGRSAGRPLELIHIDVTAHGIRYNDLPVTREDLDRILFRLARSAGQQPLVLRCDESARHGPMIRVMDVCVKNGFEEISISSRK